MVSLPFPDRLPADAAVFSGSLGGWIALELWVWWRERGAPAGESHDRGSRLWVVAGVWIGVWSAFALMYGLPAAAIAWHPAAWFALGIALMWAGILFRLWAIAALGEFFRTAVVLQSHHRIVTAGPYRHLRNPAYSGSLMTMVGLGLAMSNWASLAALAAAILLAYWRRIAVEERALIHRFGDGYRDYIRRTWAIIPFVW